MFQVSFWLEFSPRYCFLRGCSFKEYSTLLKEKISKISWLSLPNTQNELHNFAETVLYTKCTERGKSFNRFPLRVLTDFAAFAEYEGGNYANA